MVSFTRTKRTIDAFIGKRGKYHWLEMTIWSIWDLLELAPQIVTEKYVSIARLGSGLELSPEEIEQGWYMYGPLEELAISPRIQTVDQLSDNQWQEWYIFDQTTEFSDYEVWANWNGFSLTPPNSPEAETLESKFWTQIKRIGPESYLIDSANLIWVTRNSLLFEQVCQALAKLQEDPTDTEWMQFIA